MSESVRITRKQLYLLVSCVVFLGSIFFVHSFIFGAYGLRNPYPFESPSSYLRTQLHTCFSTKEYRDNGWRSDCYQQLGTRVMNHIELPAALRGLAQIQSEPQIRGWCHAFGHVLGQKEFQKTGSIGQSFLACSASIACGEGCFHGAVEGYLQSQGSSITKDVIQTACNEKESGNRVTYGACVHGLGHASMLVTGGNTEKALPMCDYLSNEIDRNACYAGVFMEDVLSFGPARTSMVKTDNPEYPCQDIPEVYRHECYASRSTFFLQQSNSNFAETAKFCDNIPSKYRADCYGTFGAQAVLMSDSARFVVSVCAGIERKDDRDSCLLQATIFKGFSTGGKLQGYADLCTEVEDRDKSSCFSFAGNDIERWYTGERAAKCLEITAKGTEEYAYCSGAKRGSSL